MAVGKGHSRRRLSNVLQDVFDAFRVLCDDCQQNTSRRIRAGSPLLPVSQCCWRESKFHGKLRLAQTHAVPDLGNVNIRDLNLGNPDSDIFSLRPSDCLFETFDYPSAHAGAFLRARLDSSFFHFLRFPSE